ncbi:MULTISPECIES: hypothetical protein [Sporosarcina]|uniref:hypothetical protein n=1 Tax=Sporosarcina TaxID=1569 RepID=UPI0005911D21|nr:MULTISPECIES: hypothetical protein [Sporosarcina]WJY27937.1 hypothetical protein QWT68_02865 [Sporosarcina sp. 0.2-SM1T-5]
MISKNKFFISAALAGLLLAGCGQTVEDEADTAVSNARDAFEMNAGKTTEKTADSGFYIPAGWKADIHENEHMVFLTKGKRTLTMQYDPNAKPESRSYYDLLKADGQTAVLREETFSDAGAFGFISINKRGDQLAEITAGTGQAQVKAIVGLHDVETAAEQMMKIARSVQIFE